ncbi:MAG TPA: ion transporter [Oligoflexus sp.]|uniref:ion transporter n=1 Tax=Oligoflexus sp. TaxID=1971216 RepID=UPI002D7F71AE|nr:ion transporter [Oligoflexus sp.]HET9237736.1 ion transporter [Oligoflexus sp.]
MNPSEKPVPAQRADWRKRMYIVIFGSDTRAGKMFDLALLWLIVLSILCVTLETVSSIYQDYRPWFRYAEWAFTAIFLVEYILRLICVPRASVYARSFLGLIDLFSIIPSFLSLYYAGAQSLLVIRAIRLLRVFRILKLTQFLEEGEVLMSALFASRHKILVFLGGVLSLVLIIGAVMHLVEGPEHGFTSIPVSIYWAVVTLTTVGYGDITPLTPLGKVLATFVMLMGYGILAVPTGIVSVEIGRASRRGQYAVACPRCGEDKHLVGSRYCFRCGERLPGV